MIGAGRRVDSERALRILARTLAEVGVEDRADRRDPRRRTNAARVKVKLPRLG